MKNFFKSFTSKFNIDKLFEQRIDFPNLTYASGFCTGMMVILSFSVFIPAKAITVEVPVIQEVPVIKVVEKKTIVKVPVKLDRNDQRQIQCLAENTYFEAGNQSTKGKIAVNNVVMNRVNDPRGRFGKTACAVVSQRNRNTCQFSWKCEGQKKIRSYEQFIESKKIAEQVYLGNYGDITGGAKFYHANYVNPGWNLQRITRIGAHIFYREG
jgi:hypothetical protein